MGAPNNTAPGNGARPLQDVLHCPGVFLLRPLVQWIECLASNQAVWVRFLQGRPVINSRMKLFEATIRTLDGKEFKDRVGAQTAQEARLLLQARYGPRAVPYLPKMIPS